MGDLNRKSAEAEDVLADLRWTYAQAKAHDGVFAELAEIRLASAIALIGPIEAELAAARGAFLAVVTGLEAADRDADTVVALVADRVWNAIGRPTRDAGYDVLFPGGNAYYVRGDVTEQPDRMRLLVGLLRRGVHPRLSRAVAESSADELERAAAGLESAVEAARAPRTRLELLEGTRDALARAAAIELAAFKRILKVSGLSEAEVLAVIPDRPRPSGGSAPSGGADLPS